MTDDIRKLREAIDDLQARLHEEVRQRAELERRCHLLEKLAYRDPATGLRTESYLHSRVREEIQRCTRYPGTATLITVCAPETSDEALPSLGMRLADELRESDHVFGLREHGLALLLVETPREGAQIVLDRLKTDLEHFVGGYGCTVTSFPVDANLAEEFISLAMHRHREMAERLNPQSPEAGRTN
jgi:GGDEF domain-containing protein